MNIFTKKILQYLIAFIILFALLNWIGPVLAQTCDHEKPELGIDCTPDYYCGGACLTAQEVQDEEDDCTGGRFLDCESCSCKCPGGQIWCPPNCQAPDYGNCVALKRQVADTCTGECGDCLPGRYDPDGDPATKEFCPAVGEQQYVEEGGEIDPYGGATVRSSANIDSPLSIVHYDQAGSGDYMNFSTNGNTQFIVNNKGHLMMGLNDPGMDLDGGNALFVLIDPAQDSGNFLLFEKGSGNEVFKFTHDGRICWNTECRSSWAEIAGGAGAWSLVENRPADKDHVYPETAGDYGDATAGEEGGLRITDTGDLYMDGDLEVEGNANIAGDLTILNDNYTFTTDVGGDLIVVDESTGDTIMNISEGGGAGLWSSGPEEGEIYYNEGNVGIGLDNPNELLHLKTDAGTNAALDIQSGDESHWAIYHDETSEDLRFWNVDNRLIITKNGALSSADDSDFYLDGEQDVQVRLDKDNTPGVDNQFKINNDQNDTVFTVDEYGNANSTGCFGPVYIGPSAPANGAQGGYDAANANCPDGAHVCTAEDIIRSINCGVGTPASGDMWISGGPPGYLAPANDCQGWTSAQGTAYGRIWDFGAGVTGKGFLTTCNLENPFACCK